MWRLVSKSNLHRLMKELSQFCLMNFTVTCGGRSGYGSSCIGDIKLASNTLEHALDFRVSVCPVALVLGFFLDPLDTLCILILLKLILYLVPWEGRELLYSDYSDIILVFFCACGIYIIVDLP